MGMSYLTSVNPQLFKNVAYVGSFGHILFNLIFNVNSYLAESSANCSGPQFGFQIRHMTKTSGSEGQGRENQCLPSSKVASLITDPTSG